MADMTFTILQDKVFRKDSINLTRIGVQGDSPSLTYEEELKLAMLFKCKFAKPMTELFARRLIVVFALMEEIPMKSNHPTASREYLSQFIGRHPYLHNVIYPEQTAEFLYAHLRKKNPTLPLPEELLRKYNGFVAERQRTRNERLMSESNMPKQEKIHPKEFPAGKIIDADETGHLYIRDVAEGDTPRDLYCFLWHDYRGFAQGCSVNICLPDSTPTTSLVKTLRPCQLRALYLQHELSEHILAEDVDVAVKIDPNSCSYVEIVNNLHAYPEDAELIGLRATDAAVTPTKWIARNFLECWCALATATNNITREDYVTILAHLKFFMEGLAPTQKTQRMKIYCLSPDAITRFLRQHFVRDALDYHYPLSTLHDIYNKYSQ